ncbi:PepSY-associated TM helix domain-containing protein [Pseudoalteromonas carrageenovora]|uniref:PepSY-associated TM helix domain-containing protein n=1 Tax=Pseudoalteromonas carrageenovora TaxID=227 RepID=UPI0026E42B13|nr:PepSY-associated TM helix domain-containing protein [Pseudoalteromonas carrageenovora]MDO6462962.1 PepSY-associated TM helix domain-containing protein [Pseudoalteromonas carrageenovora]
MKLWLRRIHLGLALISGLFLLIVSLTGAVLIYAKDIQHFIQPDKWQVTPQEKTLSNQKLIEYVQSHTQQKINFFMPEADKTLAWQFRLANRHYVSVNPYSGQLLHSYESSDTLYGFTLGLHRWLLFEDSDGNKPFKNWMSVCALMLLVNVLLGFYIWVKPKNRVKRLAIKPKAKFRVLMYQLHTVLGVYFFIPLILIAFTGMAFNWKTQTQSVLEVVTFNKVQSRPSAPKISLPLQGVANYNEAIKNAQGTFPNAQLYRVYLPKKTNDALALRVKNPGESHAYSWVWANPFTGEVLDSFDASKTNFTTQAWNFKYKFHIGGFAGPIVQFLWLLIALSLAFFIISGFYFWAKRHKWI